MSTLLDVKGLTCPLPVLRTKKALKDVAIGAELVVVSSDPGSQKDMPLFCQQTKNELVETRVEDGNFYYTIRRLV